MNLENQVCSLEIAKKLKELGVKQESYFLWCDGVILSEKQDTFWYKNHKGKICLENSGCGCCAYENDISEIFSAYIASELSEILPNCILKSELAPFDNYRLTIRKFISVDEQMVRTNNFIINYECDSTETGGAEAWLTRKFTMNIYDPNLSNAMAKMLIHLLENKLMELPK